jgi:hypothetical protein
MAKKDGKKAKSPEKQKKKGLSCHLEFKVWEGVDQETRTLAIPTDCALQIPKPGDAITVSWEGEKHHRKVDSWRFDYQTSNKGELIGLRLAICLNLPLGAEPPAPATGWRQDTRDEPAKAPRGVFASESDMPSR